ncbi:MAG: FtsX-like permease family protein [Ignavibacteria bacterium]|jgi:putative ABC transport system permease protein|nr:FtsX-like permease family protein [Ignavibacteria bacterium]MCU7522226.1 FtsX-like permease family protein [Ignavibacteria bacterium]
MLRNYIIITLRNLKRYKVYSIINILGFSIALVPVVLALLYVAYEFSCDRYNENFHRIYRVVDDGEDFFGRKIIDPILPNPLARALKDEFPEIERSARMRVTKGRITLNEKDFEVDNILIADPDFLKIFTFNFIQGNPAEVLKDPNSVCLSESTARKYFGNENPVGMKLLYSYQYDLTVRGIYKDMPANSHFTADMIIPISENTGNYGMAMMAGVTNPNQAWGMSMYRVYFLLKENASIAEVDKKYQSFLQRHQIIGSFHHPKYFSQPLCDIHLKSDIYSKTGKRSIDQIYLYLTMALILLVIASINYVNLTSARFSQRVREISIRKIIGAERIQLLRQLLTETFILSLVSLGITIILVLLVLPYFNAFVDRDIHLNLNMIAGLLGLVVIISILAGLYPSSLASSVSPLAFFRGKGISLKKTRFRNILIIAQFVFTVILIYCSFTVKNQINYMADKDPGYRKENIVAVTLRVNYNTAKLAALKNEISKSYGVLSVSAANCLPNLVIRACKTSLPGEPEEKKHVLWYGSVDNDFIDLYEMKIVKGRKFIPSDERDNVIVNETAARSFGWKDPVGKKILVPAKGGNIAKYVVGVVKDFHFQQACNIIEPLFFNIDSTERKSRLSIKIRDNNVPETLRHIQLVMKTFQPAYAFDFSFLEDELDKSIGSYYKTEFRLLYIFSVFSVFTLLISCLGLYGLVSFTTEVRSREVGIRKVLGASVLQVCALFIKEILRLILISAILSAPVAFFIMDKWLSDFPYRIGVNPWTFAVSTGTVMAVAVLSLAFQVLRSAMRNPVNSLKYE